jgi:hypothetical protein
MEAASYPTAPLVNSFWSKEGRGARITFLLYHVSQTIFQTEVYGRTLNINNQLTYPTTSPSIPSSGQVAKQTKTCLPPPPLFLPTFLPSFCPNYFASNQGKRHPSAFGLHVFVLWLANLYKFFYWKYFSFSQGEEAKALKGEEEWRKGASAETARNVKSYYIRWQHTQTHGLP